MPNLYRKPRSDARLKTLSPEQRKEIAEFAQTHTLFKTRDWLTSRGIRIGKSALGDFLCWFREEQRLDQHERALECFATQVQAKDLNVSLDKIEDLGRAFYISHTIMTGDVDAYYRSQQVELRREELELRRRKERQ